MERKREESFVQSTVQSSSTLPLFNRYRYAGCLEHMAGFSSSYSVVGLEAACNSNSAHSQVQKGQLYKSFEILTISLQFLKLATLMNENAKWHGTIEVVLF